MMLAYVFWHWKQGAVPVEDYETAQQLREEGMSGQRWWTLADLLRSHETFAPRRLPALVRGLLGGGPPGETIDVGV